MSAAIHSHWSSSRPSPDLSAAQRSFARSLNRSLNAAATSDAANEAATLSASARRLAASQAQTEKSSRLQQQGSLLHETAQTLARIGELKALHDDPAATDDERTAYAEEFGQLQFQLIESGAPKVSGHSGNPLQTEDEEPAGTEEATMEDETAAASRDGAVATGALFTDDFSTADNWVSAYGALTVSDGTFYPNATGGFGAVQSKQQFNGAFELSFDLYLPGAVDSLDISLGGATLSHLADSENTTKWGWHSVRVAYDGAGNAATYLDGSDTAADTQSGFDPAAGSLMLVNYGEGSARLRNFSLTSAPGESIAAATAGRTADTAPEGNLSAVLGAADLSSLDGAALDAAAADIAAEEAANAAEQSGLEFTDFMIDEAVDAAEGLQGTAGIASTDEAEELTESARRDILTESGNSLLAQANLSEQSALALLEWASPGGGDEAAVLA